MGKQKKNWTRNQKLSLCAVIIGACGVFFPIVLHFIPTKTVIDEEKIEEIIDKHLKENGIKPENIQEERTLIKTELTKAIERTNALAEKGNRPDAKKALSEIREKGDLGNLQKLLINERDKQQNALFQRNAEIYTVSFLRGDIATLQDTIKQNVDIDSEHNPFFDRDYIAILRDNKQNESF